MRYLELDLPEFFELQFREEGAWFGEARCRASDFQRNPDGSYLGGAGGSPIWLRCVEKHPDHFIHVDQGGEGDRYAYRLVPLDSEAISS